MLGSRQENLTDAQSVYGDYIPSKTADIIYIVLFFSATAITTIQIVRHRKDTINPIGVCFLFLGTPILEFAGYVLRMPSILSVSSSGLYLANMLVIGLGPIYNCIIILFVFSALVVFAGIHYSASPPWTISSQTIILMITITHLQIRGLAQAYDYSHDLPYRNAGSGILLGGLGLCLALLLFSAILFAIFVKRYFGEHSGSPEPRTARVRAISWVLGVNLGTVTVRTVYRIVEFSFLIRTGIKLNEVWLYAFDACPMMMGLMAFIFVLPYDLPYGRMFKLMSRKRREALLAEMEQERQEIRDDSRDEYQVTEKGWDVR